MPDHGDGDAEGGRGLRVLMLAPTPRDAAMALDILAESGIAAAVFDTFDALQAAIDQGAGALILMEEFFSSDDTRALVAGLAAQPAWSNLPLIVLSSGRARQLHAGPILHALPSVVFLERPVRIEPLVSAVRAALAARQRQYEIRDHLEDLRRSAEERQVLYTEAQAARERLDLATEAAELGIWVWNVADDTGAWENDRLYDLFGVPRTDGPVNVARFMAEFLLPDDGPALAAAIDHTLSTGARYHFLGRFRRTDGETRWIELTGKLVRADDGQPRQIIGTAADVTDRKRAEEDLRRSEERYRALFNSIDEGFVVIEMLYDPAGVAVDYRFLEMNPAFEKHTGLTRAVGRTMREFAPDHEAYWFETYGRVAATGEPVRFVNEAKNLGGRWFDVYAFRLGPAGSQRVAVLFRDITEQRRDEEAIRQSEAKLRFLAGLDARTRPLSDHDAITAITARMLGEHLEVDRCAYAEVEDESVFNITGNYVRGVPSIVGRWPMAAFGAECSRHMLASQPYVVSDTETDPRLEPDDRPAYRATTIRSVICIPLHKGGRFTAAMAVHQATPRTWTADEIDLVQLVVSRVWESLERARAERSLREGEERYRTLAENVQQLFWTCLPDGRCDYLSRRWVEYTGLSEAEQLGLDWIAKVIHPDDRERTHRVWMDSVQDRGTYDVNYRIRGADGGYRWFKARGTPIRDAAGTIVKWFGTCTDIDAQIQAEESLRETDRKKDEFLAMLAHELRNPLSAVGNAVQVIRRSSAPEHLEWAKEVLDKHVHSLSRMIDDLLDVSRITRGKIELRTETLEVLPVLAHAVETVRPLVEDRRHELTVSHSSTPMWVVADAQRLEQVVVNLLNNAAKYTDVGGQITLSARPDGDSVAITVADNGSGIPPERIPEMFQLFAQGDRSIARSEGGLGIGLTLVQNLVELHGGSITARSEGPGQGSEFTVRLPAVKPVRVRRPAQPSAASERPQSGARVLVVDDNEDSARGMVRLLRMLGHDVATALDGPSAITAALQHRPEFVLLDIGLPGMDGYEVAERLRAEGFTSATIIAVSGYGEEAARRRSRAAGFDHHLVKPVEVDTLVALMRREPGTP